MIKLSLVLVIMNTKVTNQFWFCGSFHFQGSGAVCWSVQPVCVGTSLPQRVWRDDVCRLGFWLKVGCQLRTTTQMFYCARGSWVFIVLALWRSWFNSKRDRNCTQMLFVIGPSIRNLFNKMSMLGNNETMVLTVSLHNTKRFHRHPYIQNTKLR